jgi:hypothetical protein
MTTTTPIDWPAVERIAAQLGLVTRELLAKCSPAACEWALRIPRDFPPDSPRGTRDNELAALLVPDEEEGGDDDD